MKRGPKRRLPPAHRNPAKLAAIRRQSQAMWASVNRTGVSVAPEFAPLLCELYYAAVAIWHRSEAARRREYFVFEGNRFGWEWSNLGRLRVLDADTKALLIVGPFFDVG